MSSWICELPNGCPFHVSLRARSCVIRAVKVKCLSAPSFADESGRVRKVKCSGSALVECRWKVVVLMARSWASRWICWHVRSVESGVGLWGGRGESSSGSRSGEHGGESSCKAIASGDAVAGARGIGSFTGGMKM